MSFSVWCWFNRHKPERKQVEWTHAGYIGTCKACGRTVRRVKSGKWLRFQPQEGRQAD